MTHYYKDTSEGRIWYSGFITRDGKEIFNPSIEYIDSDGWIPFEPGPPSLYMGHDPLSDDINLKKLFDKFPKSRDIVKLIKSGIVYHYSTWDVLFNGILSSDNINAGRAVLRAYSVNYMNDALEGLIIPRELFKSENRRFNGKLSERRKELEEISANKDKQRLFSVSFSKIPDSIPMWNYYGHDGNGLSIGFDASHIVNQGYDLIECIYDKTSSKELANYILNSCYGISKPQPISISLSIISKDSHFEYEKECRIPLSQHYGQCCITKRNQFHPIKYGIKKGVISPFVEVFVPLKSIKEIWIGPTNDINLAEDSLNGWLHSIGMPWVKIIKSSAPLK